jgi:hypothetical protein
LFWRYKHAGIEVKKQNPNVPLRNSLLILTVFLFLIGTGLFYWYEYRPAMVRKTCSLFAEQESEKDILIYEITYRHCLRKHGIEYYGSDERKE